MTESGRDRPDLGCGWVPVVLVFCLTAYEIVRLITAYEIVRLIFGRP